MSVNSISADVAAFTLKPLATTIPLDPPVKAAPSTNDQPSGNIARSGVVDTNVNSKPSPANKQTPDASVAHRKEPGRAMNHVIEVYNQKGKLRIKFVDSHSNVIYQIPSEMAAKIEDQMLKPETSTDTKG